MEVGRKTLAGTQTPLANTSSYELFLNQIVRDSCFILSLRRIQVIGVLLYTHTHHLLHRLLFFEETCCISFQMCCWQLTPPPPIKHNKNFSPSPQNNLQMSGPCSFIVKYLYNTVVCFVFSLKLKCLLMSGVCGVWMKRTVATHRRIQCEFGVTL